MSSLARQDSSHSTSNEGLSTMTPRAPLATPKTLRVLCFGDSLTSGYISCGLLSRPYSLSLETVLSAAFPDTNIHIETDGLPGDRVSRPGTFNDRIKLHDSPYDWTIVLGGTNDLGYGTFARDVYDALLDVWEWALDRNEGGRVLALTVPEAPGQDAWTRRITHQREVLNSMIERRRRECFHVFDLCSALPYESLSQSERELYWDDGLHLTAKGYDRMGELIVTHLPAMKQEDRPGFHLTPPRGWLNDPCAPFQDKTGVWHIYYQWVPNHTDWNAEIGWGHATSVDLFTWQADEEPVLMPSKTYDCMGVFTGNALPDAGDSEEITVVYSAINAEARSPGYTQGQEQLAVAKSTDGGKTFVKSVDNPLEVKLPDQLTGFRDPFFAPWPALAERAGHSPEQIYALVSGGILNRGPTVFLYKVSPGGTEWSFLGPLVEPAPPMPEAWAGDRGWNWECAGFFPLSLPQAAISTPTTGASEVKERQYLVVGSEGQWNDPFEVEEGTAGRDKVARPPRWQMWFSGPLISTPEGGVQMDIASPGGASGVIDWGCLYAVQTIQDRQGRRVMWGWIPDDDLSSEGRKRQGWTGSISLPRELYRLVLPNITGALSPLEPKKGMFILPQAEAGSKTIETLGIRPLVELERGRRRRVDVQGGAKVRSFECSLEVSFDPLSTESIGLSLDFDEGGLAQIIFRSKDERIVVLRPPAPTHLEDEIDTRPIHGRFTLFRTDQGWESLHLRAYFDPPILEVFANDRFALSTHIYTPPSSECSIGLTTTPNDSATSAQLDVWEFGPP